MPEFCTCGTQLVPDSLFCHKCGRPTREIVVPEEQQPIPIVLAAVPPPKPAPLPLNFHNGVAVRIAVLVAVSATVLSFLPFLNWVAAGFFAVFLYRRKTGTLLNVGAGVQMGWITGLLMFGFSAVVFAAKQIPDAMSGHLGAMLQEQLKSLPAQDPVAQQMVHFLQSGPGALVMIFISLLALFLFTTGLSMAGGALGAKMVGRD